MNVEIKQSQEEPPVLTANGQMRIRPRHKNGWTP